MRSFLIRPATATDAEQIAAIYAPFVTDSHTSFETEAPTGTEIARRIRETQRTHPYLVAVSNEEVLGYAYATSYRARAAYQWCVETTVYVKSGLRRSGVGRSLYSALFSVLALQGFHMAYAAIALPNAASAGMHEAFGFEPLGVYRAAGFKHGQWWDVGWWQRAIRDMEAEPALPLPFSHLLDTSELQAALGD
jgi:L-amino acid N-acyltransferase YncA